MARLYYNKIILFKIYRWFRFPPKPLWILALQIDLSVDKFVESCKPVYVSYSWIGKLKLKVRSICSQPITKLLLLLLLFEYLLLIIIIL